MSRARPHPIHAPALVAILLPSSLPASPPPEPLHRVVLVSFDGAVAAEYGRQRDAPAPAGFRRAAREGLSAARPPPVTPHPPAPRPRSGGERGRETRCLRGVAS